MTEDERRTYAARLVDQDEDGLLVLELDSNGRPVVSFASGAAERLLGLPPERLEGQPAGVLRSLGIDPLDLARLLRAVSARESVRWPIQLERPSGPFRVWLIGRPLADASNYLVRLAAGASDGPAAVAGPPSTIEVTEELLYRLRVEPDLALTLDWIGGAFTRVTGYRIEDVLALGGFQALIEPGDRRLFQRRAQRLYGGAGGTIEYRIRTRQGRRLWLRDRAQPVFDQDGDELVVAIVGAAQNIDQQRAQEAQLAALRQERRALSELSDGFVLIIDQGQRLRDVGGALPGEFGRRLRASVGRSLDDVLGFHGAALWRDQARAVLPGWPPVRFTFDYPTAVGQEHYQVAMAPGAARTILAVLRPQHATLRLVPALTGENGDPRLRTLIESLSEPSLLLAPDFRIQAMNDAVERLLGWPRARVVNSFFPELLAAADEHLPVLDDLARALAGTPVAGSETWARLAEGQEGRVLWSFRPLHGEAGEVVAILAQGEPLLQPTSEIALASQGEQPRLDLIIDHIADGVVTVGHDGEVVGFSRSAEAIFGYAQSEIIGSRIGRLIVVGDDGEDAWTTTVQIARRPGEVRALSGRRKGGEAIPVEVAVSEVRSNGAPLYVLTVRNVTLRRQTEETIRSLAYHDPLTGLPNRILFHDRLHQAIGRAQRNDQVIAVMILDVDRFKLINDSLGLASGDRVLRRIGQRLAQAVRRSDTVARLGGDDFLLLLPAVRSAESAAKVAQKLLDAVRPLLSVNGQELRLDASIGIALYPHDGREAETLVRNADTALYRAKERSRGSYQFYTTDMNATALERLVLETQLRKAIENDELMVQYQPQVRIDTGEVVGVEALVRWRHPELGMISPAEFIPLAEETGQIGSIGRFVLETACAQIRSWSDAGIPDLRLAVNISGRQFQDDDLVQLIAEVLRTTAFDPEHLELELTESSIMQDAEGTIGKLEELDRLGIRFSIDDFGTGYSSLSYLKRFPIKALKIDQSFIQDITSDPNDAAIAQAIIALAESMNLRVIAEGVETLEQLQLLRRYRCEEMQGYLFSRPLPPDQLLSLLREGRRLPL